MSPCRKIAVPRGGGGVLMSGMDGGNIGVGRDGVAKVVEDVCNVDSLSVGEA